MTIRRGPRPESGFYILDKSISEDPRLGWGARGLLVYLLGKPDHWEVSITNLVNQTTDAIRRSGRDQIYGFLHELEACGYLVKQQRREGGAFQGVDYIVLDNPKHRRSPKTEKPKASEAKSQKKRGLQSKPQPEKPKNQKTPLTDNPDTVAPIADLPDTVSPFTANTIQVSNDVLVSIEGSNKKPSTAKAANAETIDSAFERFWLAGMRKVEKKAARSAFKRAIGNGDPDAFADMLIADVQKRIAANQFGFDRLHPTTYLNGERWDDEIIAEPVDFLGTKKNPQAANQAGSSNGNLTNHLMGSLSHDGLKTKDYAKGATTDADLPSYLRG